MSLGSRDHILYLKPLTIHTFALLIPSDLNIGGSPILREDLQQKLQESKRYWSATATEGQLQKIRANIQQMTERLTLMVSVHTDEKLISLQRQISHSAEESPQNLLEIVPVGMDDQVEVVKQLLDIEGNSPALAVILYGFGGIGKSTLAASVIKKLYLAEFSFSRVKVYADSRDKFSHIVKLQKDIIFDLSKEKIHLRNVDEGRQRIAQILESKSTFLFIDNIVDKNYVKELLPWNLLKEKTMDLSAGKQKLRILVTSRENNVREVLNIECKDYSVHPISDDMAVELLRNTILENNQKITVVDFDENVMMNAVAKACCGVPLLLDAYARHLKENRSEQAYKDTLDSLKEGNFRCHTDEDLSKQLLYVYHKMEEDAKEAFLDICIFFNGWPWNVVSSIVGERLLKELVRRALVKKSVSDQVLVHDVIRLMGRKEAQGTRLHSIKELLQALEDEEDLKNIKGIWLLHNQSLVDLECKHLDTMHKSLRVLALGGWIRLIGECQKTFGNLRFLHVGDVDTFPFKDASKMGKMTVFYNESMSGMNLPVLPQALKHLKLKPPADHNYPYAALPIIWKNMSSLGGLEKFELETSQSVQFPEDFELPSSLIELNLSRCNQLPRGFGRLTSLRKLTLKECKNLEALPKNFGRLRSLKLLNLNGCQSLTALPDDFGMLSSLENLSLRGCNSSIGLPENFGNLLSLKSLDMGRCENLTVLPEDFGQLSSLQCLNLNECFKLMQFPASLDRLTSLRGLNLRLCESLTEDLPMGFWRLSTLESLYLTGQKSIPKNIGDFCNLTELTVEDCHFLTNFGHLRSLKEMQVFSCHGLKELPEGFHELPALEKLTFFYCRSLLNLPEKFPELPALKELALLDCINLSSLPGRFGELKCLSELYLSCQNLTSLPDGFGNLKNLETLFVRACRKLERLPDDFECLSSLRKLYMYECEMLEGEMLHRIAKLNILIVLRINGSRKLEEKWKEMQKEGLGDYPFLVELETCTQAGRKEYERAAGLAFFHGESQLVNYSGQSIPSLDAIQPPATVALLMGYGKEVVQLKHLKTVMDRIVSEYSHIVYIELDPADDRTAVHEEILSLMPQGSFVCTDFRTRSILGLMLHFNHNDMRSFALITADVTVEHKARKRLINFNDISASFYKEATEPFAEPGVISVEIEESLNSIVESENKDDDYWVKRRAQFEQSSKFRQLVRELEKNGINHFNSNASRTTSHMVRLGDLVGELFTIFICKIDDVELFHEIYKELKGHCTSFEAVWIPVMKMGDYGFGRYARATRCMPSLTLPNPTLIKITDEFYSHVIVFDGEGRNAISADTKQLFISTLRERDVSIHLS
eukprot:Gb_35001 [translate_table: standard]